MYLGQEKSGRLAMVKGEWQFHTVGQGKKSFLMTVELLRFLVCS